MGLRARQSMVANRRRTGPLVLGRAWPRRIHGAAVLGTVKARPGSNAVGLRSGATADLDCRCARRPRHFAVGTEESLRRGRTKERDKRQDEAKQDACSPSATAILPVPVPNTL